MEQPSGCSSLPDDSKNVINPKKSRLGIAMMLIGCTAFASSHAQAATLGFINPSSPNPLGSFDRYISSPDSPIVNIGVRLAAGGNTWQGSCTLKGNLVARGVVSGPHDSVLSLGALEGLHYRFLSSTSFSLTTIPDFDRYGWFETVEQDILFEAIQAPSVEQNVRVRFYIANLEAKCGDVDVTAYIRLASGDNYGGDVIIADTFNQPSFAAGHGTPRFLAAATNHNQATRTKI